MARKAPVTKKPATSSAKGAANPAKSFRAPLERLPGSLGWVIARLPFEPADAWKKMIRLRVKVEIAGEVFRTSLFPESQRGADSEASPTTARGYFVLVNKKMQQAAGACVGGLVDLSVEPDLDEREAEMPPEFARLLKGQKALIKWMEENLSDSIHLEIGKWILGVKSPEARQRRAEQIAERLMLTMEGEKVLPPILEVAFRQNPAARKGWNAMSPSHRRGHLMGIFHYQTPEGRENRVAKVIEDCARKANP